MSTGELSTDSGGKAPYPLGERKEHLLMAVGCQKCFCVTFDKSNKTSACAGMEWRMSTIIKRTISVMLGKGSVNHNDRKFKAANIDAERTSQNITYCNEPIKEVYHDLF
jgi:hypothetical protein